MEEGNLASDRPYFPTGQETFTRVECTLASSKGYREHGPSEGMLFNLVRFLPNHPDALIPPHAG